jgi:hypothetical protein
MLLAAGASCTGSRAYDRPPMSRWRTAKASVRGANHVARNRPNEDCVEVYESDDLTLVAVADGHGSDMAPRSQRGSALACSAALAAAERVLKGRKRKPDADLLRIELGEQLAAAWRQSVAADREQTPLTPDELELVGDAPPEYAYGSTLLLIGRVRSFGFALQLGDGHIVLIGAGGEAALAFPEEVKRATETYSLCMVDAERYVRARPWAIDGHHPRIVTASTDGWGDAFVDRRWYDGVGTQLHTQLLQHGVDHIQGELVGWLQRPAEQYGDDATMGILFETDAGEDDRSSRSGRRWLRRRNRDD